MTSYRAVCDERSRFEALLSTADASKAQVFQRGCFVCVCVWHCGQPQPSPQPPR